VKLSSKIMLDFGATPFIVSTGVFPKQNFQFEI
jgi:hypothetical protein